MEQSLIWLPNFKWEPKQRSPRDAIHPNFSDFGQNIVFFRVVRKFMDRLITLPPALNDKHVKNIITLPVIELITINYSSYIHTR